MGASFIADIFLQADASATALKGSFPYNKLPSLGGELSEGTGAPTVL